MKMCKIWGKRRRKQMIKARCEVESNRGEVRITRKLNREHTETNKQTESKPLSMQKHRETNR